MSERTTFAGLLELDPGEPITTNGGEFTQKNISTIARLLRIGAVSHRHDGLGGLPDPTSAMYAYVTPSAGAITGNTHFALTYTAVDARGGETMAAPATEFTTPAQIAPPSIAPTGALDVTQGIMPAGDYFYAMTYTDGQGGETTIGPTVMVNIPPGNASAAVDLSGLSTELGAGMDWRLWRSYEGADWHLVTQAATDTFVDAGFDPPDSPARPPERNTTSQSNVIVMTLPAVGDDPALASATAINIYLAGDSTFPSPSFYAQYPIASGGETITISSYTVQTGSPPTVSLSIPDASQIYPDTDLAFGLKSPVPAASALAAGTQGDARVTLDTGALWGVLGPTAAVPADWSELAGAGGPGGSGGAQYFGAWASADAYPASAIASYNGGLWWTPTATDLSLLPGTSGVVRVDDTFATNPTANPNYALYDFTPGGPEFPALTKDLDPTDVNWAAGSVMPQNKLVGGFWSAKSIALTRTDIDLNADDGSVTLELTATGTVNYSQADQGVVLFTNPNNYIVIGTLSNYPDQPPLGYVTVIGGTPTANPLFTDLAGLPSPLWVRVDKAGTELTVNFYPADPDTSPTSIFTTTITMPVAQQSGALHPGFVMNGTYVGDNTVDDFRVEYTATSPWEQMIGPARITVTAGGASASVGALTFVASGGSATLSASGDSATVTLAFAGSPGPAGPAGPAGSGSLALGGSGGVPLVTPITYLEFVGSAGASATVTNLGGGSARVTLTASGTASGGGGSSFSGSPYDQAVLGDVPRHFWPLNELSGGYACDTVGGIGCQTQGTITENVTGIGDGETAFQSDGSTGYLQSLNAAGQLPQYGAFTLEFWMYCTALPGAGVVLPLWSTRGAGSSNNALEVRIDHSGLVTVVIGPGGTGTWLTTSVTSAGAISLNAWHHVVVTGTLTGYQLYIDGSLNSSGSYTVNGAPRVLDAGVAMQMMGSPNSAGDTGFLAGKMAKVALYSYVLSAARVAAHYAAA